MIAGSTCCAKIGMLTAATRSVGAIGDAIDIARARHAGLARDRGGGNRRLLILIVHVNQPRGARSGPVSISPCREVQTIVAIPQHDALAGCLVDGDDGKPIGALARHHMRDVDAALAELARGSAGRCGRGRRSPDTPFANRTPRTPPSPSPSARRSWSNGCEMRSFAVGAVGFGRGGQAIDVIDGVAPHAEHVPLLGTSLVSIGCEYAACPCVAGLDTWRRIF